MYGSPFLPLQSLRDSSPKGAPERVLPAESLQMPFPSTTPFVKMGFRNARRRF